MCKKASTYYPLSHASGRLVTMATSHAMVKPNLEKLLPSSHLQHHERTVTHQALVPLASSWRRYWLSVCIAAWLPLHCCSILNIMHIYKFLLSVTVSNIYILTLKLACQYFNLLFTFPNFTSQKLIGLNYIAIDKRFYSDFL